MKNTGIIRKLDGLGRVVIPIEIRTEKDIKEKDPVEIYLDRNDIVMRKVEGNVSETGIKRLVDELGRVVIPIEIRTVLELEEGDKLELFLEKEKMIFRKHHIRCMYCGNKKAVDKLLEKPVCENCIQKLKRELEN